MGTITRPQLLSAAFCFSLCGLGLTAGAQKLAQVAEPVSVIIDDGDFGYVGTKMTGPVKYDTGYNGDTAYFTPQKNVTGADSSASWTFTNLTPGSYDVYATWGEYYLRTKKAEFTISGNSESIFVDQTKRPSTAIGNRPWQPLGTATVGSDGKIVVTLKASSDSTTIADAVMVVKKEASNPNGGICLTPVCAAPKPGCTYVPDSAVDANGCPLRPCGELKCEPTIPPVQPTVSCGNATVEGTEQCDDGNRKPGDGCNSACRKEVCGDGIVTSTLGEECDSRYNPTNATQPYEGCTTACKITYCGDGVVQRELKEACDDGNGVNGDGCSVLCQTEQKIFCGKTLPGGGSQCEQMTETQCGPWGGKPFQTNQACFEGLAKTCTDTDGGNKPDTFGTVTVVENGQNVTKTDACIASTTGKTLSEYSCEGTMAIATAVECPNGCDKGACKKAPVSQCGVAPLKGKPMQNQTNPSDVNNDGKVDFGDVRAIYGFYNEEPIGAKIATRAYMNVDGSTDFFGRETFDVQDILYVVNNVNYCNVPTEKKLNLASVTMGCEANVNVAKVAYDKNFEGCAHVVDAAGKRLDGQNFLCPNAGPILIPLAKLAISTNQSVKICDGLDYSKCSQPVTVTGSPCGAQPPSITLGNAVISCNAENKTIFTVNYQANNVNSTFLHLVDELQTLRHTTNLFLSNQTQTSAPISSFIDIAPGLKLKLCTTNYGTCSSVIAVTGKACGAAPTTERLSVAVKYIGATDTAVRNEKSVTLLRFDARGNDAYPTIKKIVLKAVEGSALNAQNYSLWADLNNDGQMETPFKTGVSAQNGLITFENLDRGGIGLQMNADNAMEIRGDIASSPVDGTLRLAFAEDAPGYIVATLPDGTDLAGIKTNGACPTASCAIGVSTVASKKYMISSQGDLFVTLDSTPTRSRQILAGTLSDTILRLQFRAQNEDIDVTDLQFTSRGSNASSVDRLELYKDGATTAFATATVSGCGSDQVNRTDRGLTVGVFCANMENGQLIVKDGENLDVLVKARLKSDDPSPGAISGQGIQFFLSSRAVSNDATGEGAVRARGKMSSNVLVANDGDATNEGEVFIGTDSPAANAEIAGLMNTVVLSKIVSITNANPDADNTNVPVGISPIGQFKFTASTNSNTFMGLNKATLNTVTFTVNATNISLDASSFKFYNKADASTKAACTVTSGGGTPGSTVTNVTCSNVHLAQSSNTGAPIDAEIESGESSTYVLEANVTNAKTVPTAASSLQVTLQDFAAPYPTNSSILWTDKDAVGTMQFKWIEYSETVVRSTSYKS